MVTYRKFVLTFDTISIIIFIEQTRAEAVRRNGFFTRRIA